MSGIPIKQISAKDSHSLVLSEYGELYSFGSSKHGELGHGDKTNCNIPKLVEFFKDKPIAKISAGGKHSLVLTRDNKLYGFGNNRHGQTGRKRDNDDQVNPLHIKLLDNTNITEIAAGDLHSLVRTGDGEIYGFGYGEYGQLGHGDDRSRLPKLLIFSP